MDLATKLHLRSTFLTGSSFPVGRNPIFRQRLHSMSTQVSSKSVMRTNCSIKCASLFNPNKSEHSRISAILSAVAIDTVEISVKDDIESLFSESNAAKVDYRRGNRQFGTGASSISSGVRLENVTKSYKGVTVLKDISWEVKKGEKVGLFGVNGAVKTTQMRIIAGLEELGENYCWVGSGRTMDITIPLKVLYHPTFATYSVQLNVPLDFQKI